MANSFFNHSAIISDYDNLIVVLGHGQLARMMYLEATHLGLNIIAVNANSRECVHPVDGSEIHLSIDDAFKHAIAITSEFEHLPAELVSKADKTGKYFPSAEAIKAGGDRIIEKQLLDSLQIDNCQHVILKSTDDLHKAKETLGDKLILKTSRDGYDGYGQWRVFSEQDFESVSSQLETHPFDKMPLIAERCIKFDREVSLIGVTDKNGNHSYYPLTENHHADGQLVLSIGPAPKLSLELQQLAQSVHQKIADKLNYCGVLAIEFFQVGERLLVNEIAPRVHNSGHWTQQGSVTSQFENHIRAVAGYPLGSTKTISSVAMINYVGNDKPKADLFRVPNVHLHWYDKSLRPKRKMGHINVVADRPEQLLKLVDQVKGFIPADLAKNLSPLLTR
jgi:5-(carboxyamino)imidazole ribonucleotide synthase